MTILGRENHPKVAAQDLSDLVAKVARTRDKDAFATLFFLLGPKVKGFLRGIGASDTLAEELTQEVMLVVWEKAGDFDPEKSSVTTWVYRIARNRRIDVARREKTRRANTFDPILLRGDPKKPDEALSESLTQARLCVAIDNLSNEQSGLLRLSFFDGLSHREIAEKTGLALGTVKSRVRLALDHLRQALDD